MGISMDKKYKTREGRDVKLYTTSHIGRWCVVGSIGQHNDICSWDSRGKHKAFNGFDLIEVPLCSDFKDDDKVICWNAGSNVFHRGHFAGIHYGKPCIYPDGRSSWTCEIGSDLVPYDNCDIVE